MGNGWVQGQPTLIGRVIMTDFVKFPKIPRLFRDMVVTEKIDGTNASIHIAPANEIGVGGLSPDDPHAIFQNTYALGFGGMWGAAIYAGSRTRWLTRDKDNYGFAAWVQEHAEELIEGLGEGTHYGEWWGQGIQRKYGLDHKRFSLFNVDKWAGDRPACCHVVPAIHRGPFSIKAVENCLSILAKQGSFAADGFMSPEGVVIYHQHARSMFKVTIGDDGHKG